MQKLLHEYKKSCLKNILFLDSLFPRKLQLNCFYLLCTLFMQNNQEFKSTITINTVQNYNAEIGDIIEVYCRQARIDSTIKIQVDSVSAINVNTLKV